jgi:TonB family protein
MIRSDPATASTAPGTATPSTTTPAGTGPNCTTLTVFMQNPGRACFDTRPVPNTAAILQPPSTCTGTITPANITVNVSAQGEVITASITRQSSCQAFSATALAYVQDMTFRPATKSRQPVAGWAVVPVRPQR